MIALASLLCASVAIAPCESAQSRVAEAPRPSAKSLESGATGVSETGREIVLRNDEPVQIARQETLRLWTQSDSRCPQDANCYWQGDTSAGYVYLRTGKRHRHGVLIWSGLPGSDAKVATACLGWRRITLTGVEPRTRSDFQTRPEEYRFHVRLGRC